VAASLSDVQVETPDFLVIGHATRDLLPNGEWRLGGSVAYAALTASRLGLRAAVVTSGPEDVEAALRQILPDIAIHCVRSVEATVFENIYASGRRRQYLRGRAASLTLEAVPAVWRAAPILLLAPLAGEVDPALALDLRSPLRAVCAATAQGWLRRWGADGLVSPRDLDLVEQVLPLLDALILSDEDLPSSLEAGGPDAVLQRWALTVPLVVATCSRDGAVLFRKDEEPTPFSGYPAQETDPTGAGDVFATAFLVELYRAGDPGTAVDFANRVASCSIEHAGVDGIPTRAELYRRFDMGVPG
jgi:sugar/nucleoside kinase (ribokinase family)